MNETPELISNILLLGGILVGSRGLDVANSSSDYDIVIHSKIIEDSLLQNKEFDILSVIVPSTNSRHDYFRVLPIGGVAIVKIRLQPIKTSPAFIGNLLTVDLLLYDSEEDVETVRKAMEVLKLERKLYLYSKSYRIERYEDILVSMGFIRNINKEIK